METKRNIPKNDTFVEIAFFFSRMLRKKILHGSSLNDPMRKFASTHIGFYNRSSAEPLLVTTVQILQYWLLNNDLDSIQTDRTLAII